MFACRIIVDIGLKALSPAINDPTTAVLALDQVHRLLRMVGRLQAARRGHPRRRRAAEPICRTPNWEDYVDVACSEIRACGAKKMQIARRMRAMLGNLRSAASRSTAVLAMVVAAGLGGLAGQGALQREELALAASDSRDWAGRRARVHESGDGGASRHGSRRIRAVSVEGRGCETPPRPERSRFARSMPGGAVNHRSRAFLASRRVQSFRWQGHTRRRRCRSSWRRRASGRPAASSSVELPAVARSRRPSCRAGCRSASSRRR